MSWNDVMEGELELKFEGRVTLAYTCPRCGYINIVKLDAHQLLYSGIELHCRNVKVCGENELNLDASLCITGYYKGLMDKPLENNHGS